MPILLERERSIWLRELKITNLGGSLSVIQLREYAKTFLAFLVSKSSGSSIDYTLSGTAYQKIASDLLWRTKNTMSLNKAFTSIESNIDKLSEKNLQALFKWFKKIVEYKLVDQDISNIYSDDITEKFNIFTSGDIQFHVDLDVDNSKLVFILALKRILQFFNELLLFLPPLSREVISRVSFQGWSKLIVFDNFLEVQGLAKKLLDILADKLFELSKVKCGLQSSQFPTEEHFGRSNSVGALSPSSPILTRAKLRRPTLTSSHQDFQPSSTPDSPSHLTKLSL